MPTVFRRTRELPQCRPDCAQTSIRWPSRSTASTRRSYPLVVAAEFPKIKPGIVNTQACRKHTTCTTARSSPPYGLHNRSSFERRPKGVLKMILDKLACSV